MKNHHCPDKSGRQCLLRLRESKQINILSYSVLLFSASKERWCRQRRTGAAARARSAPTAAAGLSAQTTSLPGANDKLEPSLFVSNWSFPMVSMKHETFPDQDVRLQK